MGLLILGIIFVILFQRKKNTGFLEFKQAFKSGILYTVFLALILAVFSYLYYKYIAPDAIAFYLSEAKKQVTETIKPEDLPNFEKNVKDFFSPFKMFMSTVIFGIIISLLVAAIFQKKNPTMPFSQN
jgi:amino acid transporter